MQDASFSTSKPDDIEVKVTVTRRWHDTISANLELDSPIEPSELKVYSFLLFYARIIFTSFYAHVIFPACRLWLLGVAVVFSPNPADVFH